MAIRAHRKRGAATRRESLSSGIRGITTAAVETGVAIAVSAFPHVMKQGSLYYATNRTGAIILNANTPIGEQSICELSQAPCVIGGLDRHYHLLTTHQALSKVARVVSLYEQPIEFQHVTYTGIARFSIPYTREIKKFTDNGNIKTMSLLNRCQYPKDHAARFQQSSGLVAEQLHGKSHFMPWGVMHTL